MWSHCRRCYLEPLNTDKRAALAIVWIRQLFEVERKTAGRTPDERLALRQDRSRPVVEELGR